MRELFIFLSSIREKLEPDFFDRKMCFIGRPVFRLIEFHIYVEKREIGNVADVEFRIVEANERTASHDFCAGFAYEIHNPRKDCARTNHVVNE